jgi:hypothetical protein
MTSSQNNGEVDIRMPIVHLPSATQFAVVALTETAITASCLPLSARRNVLASLSR